MWGHGVGDEVWAHRDSQARIAIQSPRGRQAREELERMVLAEGATLSQGAGHRVIPEKPDPERMCFERDRDRIIHSPAFRRLAGKTQVVVYPSDHQRTRLTHALEVAQVAGSIARGVGANATLTEAIALGHDCGHGPGGHASEDAFTPYIDGGYDHGPWGADVVLKSLNLCWETLDGIRNHSWSQPAPETIEGEIVSWADRIAYCAHDLEDAVHAGIVRIGDIPPEIADVVGTERRSQIHAFVRGLVTTTCRLGMVAMTRDLAEALARLRAFNYERIYMRPESQAQSAAVIAVLQALVEHYIEHLDQLPADYRVLAEGDGGPARAAVTYVAGMTDRFAFRQAEELLEFDPVRIPRWV
ncbi:MAG: HD domain-containing protein [Propionibacteriaceae bacterium]|nr:HD domain-containing protein [Propionibacteriaceae bacterium]